LTPGVNFNNILLATFTCIGPKITKKTDDLTVFFALLGSEHAKPARKTLMELTPDLASYASYAYFCKCPYHSSLVSSRNSSEQKMHLNGIVSGETF